MQSEQGTSQVLGALDHVAGAQRVLSRVAHVDWSSPAAHRFRVAVAEAELRLRQVQRAVEQVLGPVAAADADVDPMVLQVRWR